MKTLTCSSLNGRDLQRFCVGFAGTNAHGTSVFDRDLQVASLDHSMWFHRPCRMDDWLLYTQDSPSAFGARGMTRGSLFDRSGTLIASVAQEGLIRKKASE